MKIDYHDAIRETYTVSLRNRLVIVVIADIEPDQSPCLSGIPPEQVNMRKLEDDAESIFKTCLRPCTVERLPVNNFLTLALGIDGLDDTPEHHEALWNGIDSSLQRSLESAESCLGLRLHLAVSSAHRNIGNVYDAYVEAQAIIEHFSFFVHRRGVITAEEVMSERLPDEQRRIPLEKQWFSYTAAFQFRQAKEMLREIVSDKMSSMRTAVTIKTELFSRLNYTVYFICDCRGVNHSVRAELQNKVQTLWAVHDKEAIFAWIDQIYDAIEQVLSMDEKDIVWSERIISYIRSNYMDPQLDVNTISRRFGLNSSYVSHVFRKSTGIRLIDYIHNVRIEHITQLLTGTEKSISEIAKETGYADPQALSRVFRRYMKISPTEYRRSRSRL